MSNEAKSNEISPALDVRLKEMEDRLGSRIDSLDQKVDLKTDSLSGDIEKQGAELNSKIEDKAVAHEKTTAAHIEGIYKSIDTLQKALTIESGKQRDMIMFVSIILAVIIAAIGWFLSSNSQSKENFSTFIVQQEIAKICSVIYFDEEGQRQCLHYQGEGD